jgi:hypothetical protein
VSNFNCFHSEILFEHLARVLADVSIVERAQRQAASGPSSSSQLTESVKPPYHDAPAPMSILNLWRGLMIAVSSGEKAPGGFTESGSGKRPSGGGSSEGDPSSSGGGESFSLSGGGGGAPSGGGKEPSSGSGGALSSSGGGERFSLSGERETGTGGASRVHVQGVASQSERTLVRVVVSRFGRKHRNLIDEVPVSAPLAKRRGARFLAPPRS